MKVAALALLADPAAIHQVQASSSTPGMNSNYPPTRCSSGELNISDTNFTNTWVTNPVCDNNAAVTTFFNVGFCLVTSVMMEQSLGKVTECADVIMPA